VTAAPGAPPDTTPDGTVLDGASRALLVDALDRWAAAAGGAAGARAALDGHPPPDGLADLARLGLLTAHLPEHLGGGGGGVVAAAAVHERLAAGLVGGGYPATVVAVGVLAEAGAEPDVVLGAGEGAAAAPALVAPPGAVGLRAEPAGAGRRLVGRLPVVLGPADAPRALVRAVDVSDAEPAPGLPGGGSARWYLLDRGDLAATPLPPAAAIDGSRPLAEVAVDAVVPADRHLPGVDDATVDAHLVLAVAAESTAITARCRDVAAHHAVTRHQFGRPIGQFQAVKHHVADLAVDAARAEALLSALEAAWAGPARPAAVAAAATAAELAVTAAATCIQVLGGIGFTWEHDAPLVLRRALQNRQLLGPAADRRIALGRLARQGEAGLAADGPGAEAATDLGIARWVAPVIEALGDADQRARWLPPLRSGQERWCQLFSEPDAGSDLASLTTRAVPDGPGWRITGQKVWTSRAHEARWGLCLARTSEAPRSRGISCFVVDLHAPGVEVRPLRQLTGDARFNEVFLDAVAVPAGALLGEAGRGWDAVQLCLAEERRGMAAMTFADGGLDRLLAAAAAWAEPGDALLGRLGARVADELAIRAMQAPSARRAEPADPSVRKLVTMRHRQASADLGLEAAGLAGCAPGAEGDHWRHAYLDGRGLTIGGGTTEILKNVVAERLLGLPRDPRP